MATWIAHLRIAENLLAHLPDLDAAQFAIGNIAPDSGIPDEKWEKFNPPPQVTHFKRSDSVHKDIADLDFIAPIWRMFRHKIKSAFRFVLVISSTSSPTIYGRSRLGNRLKRNIPTNSRPIRISSGK